jgi:TolB protein
MRRSSVILAMRRRAVLWISAAGLTAAQGLAGGLVFSVLEDGHWVAYYQENRGAAPVRVDPSGGEDQTSVRVSPPGEMVAFETPASEVKVFRKDAASGRWTHAATHQAAVRPAWHAGFDDWIHLRFVASSSGEDSDIWGKGPGRPAADCLVRQTGNQDYPSVSPDGRQMAYISAQVVSPRLGAVQVHQQLWVMDFSRAEARQLLLEGRAYIEPAWSPDGHQIAVASDRSGEFQVWLVRPDGQGLRQVTSGPGPNTRPAWSPDGRQMLVTTMQDGRYGLALVNLDDGSVTSYQPFPDRPQAEVRDADWK